MHPVHITGPAGMAGLRGPFNPARGVSTAGNHTDAVVLRCTCDVPPIYLARQPAPATCAAAGRHRHLRPSEVHAGYMCGQSPGGDISRGAIVLAESTYSDRAVFPGARVPGDHGLVGVAVQSCAPAVGTDEGRLRDGRGGGSSGAQDDPAEVAPGGHQVDCLGDLSEREVDVLRVQPAGGEQVP
jgi:hypothetical protein